eukprot:Tbor_TRINITY_DN5215_c0_g2::TRINITY_DN5215_c0_g2_i1::g.16831::m.16831/K15117/SLC25A34_35, OAC1; solute carrier family 25, member 34/35
MPQNSSSLPLSNTVLFAEGAVASAVATVISNPFEVIKIRIQLQGELMRKGEYIPKYKGVMSGIVKIAKEEGITALQKGLSAAVAHQVVLNGVRFGAYSKIKTSLEEVNGGSSVMVTLTSGCLAGVLGAAASSPLMTIKTRLQSKYSSCTLSSEVIWGKQHNYNGVFDAIRQIYSDKAGGGLRSLYHGVCPLMARTCVSSGVQLGTYDTCKEYSVHFFHIPDTDIRVHIVASAIASLAVVAAINPMDLIVTRVYNNGSNGRSLLSTVSNVIAVEGLLGLYKGSVALWSRMTPHFIFTFVALEQIRNYTR